MSRTKHHHDTIAPRRYVLLDRPPRRRALRALWHLREALAQLTAPQDTDTAIGTVK